MEIYLRAQEGLAELEPDPGKRLKYIDFIAQYANLSEAEQAQYEAYLQQSSHKEAIMGPVQQAIEESRQQGIQKGREEGKQEKAVEVARTLLGKGIATDVISEASGLSEEEIQKLSIH